MYARVKVFEWMASPQQLLDEWEDFTPGILCVSASCYGLTELENLQVLDHLASFLLENTKYWGTIYGDALACTKHKIWLTSYFNMVLERNITLEADKTLLYETIPMNINYNGPSYLYMPVLEYWEKLLVKGAMTPNSFLRLMWEMVNFTEMNEEYQMKVRF